MLQLPHGRPVVYYHWSWPTAQRKSPEGPHLLPIVRPSIPSPPHKPASFFHGPPAPAPVAVLTAPSEKKIDRIENRLGNIECLLKNLSITSPQSDPLSHIHTPTTNFNAPPASSADVGSSDEESAYGGDNGIAAQTAFATEFLHRAVKRTSLREVNPKMEAALANLSQLVEIQNHRSISHGPRFPLQSPLPPGGLSKLPMPPATAVVPLLKQIKGKPNCKASRAPTNTQYRPLASPPTLFTTLCGLVGITDFAALCRMVYFATEDFSDALFITVNIGLHNLFVEQHALASDPAVRAEYQSYSRMCRVNSETGLANLPLFLSPKLENAQALLLGALYAVDVSRPSVAWILNSAAAQLCQTGGFHRLCRHQNDTPAMTRVKRIVFWHVFMLDKGLSLRLGRAAVIQECDIEIPWHYDFAGITLLESTAIASLWIQISALQGKIYDQLYSPSALAQPPGDIAQRAMAIAAECSRLSDEADVSRWEVLAQLQGSPSSEVIAVFLKGDEVQCQVILTLAYRVIPAPDGSLSRFCDECLQAARRAMAIHQETMQMMRPEGNMKSLYFHWNLLLTPYAPFFVLFCYVIETSSQDDLRILHDFVASLETARQESETVENLYRLCQVMHDVASLYVEAKAQQQQDQTMIPIGDEFEMYLSQLGVMPNGQQAVAPAGVLAADHLGPNLKMTDWLAGSYNMIGLLEEDLSQMDGYRWMQQPSAPL
ncbi:hypothetical protein S40288_07245 [Stachybotrys chartarum IBT 40288]|nr:hypothetical protein S40288_07245 [Stachybotrys chartarum IBT 40288]